MRLRKSVLSEQKGGRSWIQSEGSPVVLIIGFAFQNWHQIGTVGQGASWVLRGLGPASVSADEGWKREFEDVCARAGDEEGLSIEDLRG